MQVLELVTFKAKTGVSKEQVVEINELVMEQVKKFPGFIYRSLCWQQGSESWLDVVYWQDQASVDAAQEKFMASAVCQQLMEIIDVESTKMQHADILLSSCTESETCG